MNSLEYNSSINKFQKQLGTLLLTLGLIIFLTPISSAQKIGIDRILDTLYCSSYRSNLGDILIEKVPDTVLDLEVKNKVENCYRVTLIDSGRKELLRLLKRKRKPALLLRWTVSQDDKRLVYSFNQYKASLQSYRHNILSGWPDGQIDVYFIRNSDLSWIIDEIKYYRSAK